MSFLDAQGQLTLKSGGILPLTQAFMVVLVTCKNEEDPIKNEGSRVLTRFYPIISLWEFFFSNAQGELTMQSMVESGRNSISSEI